MNNFKSKVFKNNGVYVIAEIGANHNGDMNLARDMIKAAKESGADCVKFQSWQPSSIASETEYENNTNYTDSKKKHFGSLREMVEKYYLTYDQHFELKNYCDEISIDFASSPFTNEEVDLLVDLDVPFIKIASMDIVYEPLLKKAARTGKPVIISTGMATLAEIDKAINILKKESCDEIALLHCISIYPPKNEDIRLLNIKMLADTFDLPVGLSDHSFGAEIPLASVALGSRIIEKHFTTDKNLPGWDHEISADPDELFQICRGSQMIYESLGGLKRIVNQEEENKKLKFRRSIVYKTDLKAGHILTEGDLLGKRPGTGIPFENYRELIGRSLNQDVSGDALALKGHLR